MPKWIAEADDGVDSWRGGMVSEFSYSTINQMEVEMRLLASLFWKSSMDLLDSR
jgi:hypothetical protein